MLQILWDTGGYFFWLLAVSLLCWLLERLAPWRSGQRAWRDQFGQDLFWLVFNGHYAGVLVAFAANGLLQQLGQLLGGWLLPPPSSLRLLAAAPLWAQVLGFLVIKDFCEWLVHRLLHRVPWLWEFHKLHHSITAMDWIGNMRFHWMEIVVYKGLTYLPLVVLGVEGQVLLWIAVFSTLIGHLNHANLKLDWGPLRYLLNSSRFHAWHHDAALHGPHGQNYAIVFSLWDWLFGTAYMPANEEQPARFGFERMEVFPRGLLPRLIYPFWKRGAR